MAEVGFVGWCDGRRGCEAPARRRPQRHRVERTKEKATLADRRGDAVGRDAARGREQSEIVLHHGTNTAAVRAVTDGPDGILAGLTVGKVYADMSTASPRELARSSPFASPTSART